MLKLLEQWLFPPTCVLCDHKSESSRDLCLICEKSLPLALPRCLQCGRRVEKEAELWRCEQCLENPPPYDRAYVLFEYTPPITDLILGLKFGQRLAYGRLLGEVWAEQILSVWYQQDTLPEALLPVPLHSKRLCSRGFNQVLELLRPLTKRHAFTLLEDACERVRDTPAQARQSREKRQKQMEGAFSLKHPIPFEHVAIVDDVLTTGSTVRALCHTLKNTPVQRVDVWTLAAS